MSENPFDDLEVDTSDGNETTETSEEQEPVQSTGASNEPRPTSKQENKSESAEADLSGPAFEYADVRQKPLYARDETWNQVEDELGITVTPALRRMGIRDEETREIHDSLLEIAIDHIEELPERIADKRRQLK